MVRLCDAIHLIYRFRTFHNIPGNDITDELMAHEYIVFIHSHHYNCELKDFLQGKFHDEINN